MKTPSRLYRKLPAWAKPFCTVQIGNKSYGDNDIVNVSIRFGGSSNSATVPTATIEIKGTLPIGYNAPVIITVNNHGGTTRQRRFTGRVGEQSVTDSGKHTITTVHATASSIALFRSEAKLTIPKGASIAYMISQLRNEISRKELSNLTLTYSASNNIDKLAETQEFSPKDVLSLCSKNAVSITHTRSGELRFTHPADKNSDLIGKIPKAPPVLRNQVLAPAEYLQPISYMDYRTEARVLFQGDDGHYKSDLTEFYLPPGEPYPVDVQVLDLTDIAYTKEHNQWRYPLRIATYQNLMLAYQLKGLEIDLLELMNGSEYDRMVYDEVLSLHEGDFISLGGDWPSYTAGPKSVLAYTETITPKSYRIAFDLLDPRIHFGLNDWLTPLPDTPIYVWNQASVQWDKAATTWEGA